MPGRRDGEPLTLACDLTVFSADEHASHGAALAAIRDATLERLELPNGYRYRLTDDDTIISTVAGFIARERRCCPFFTFALEVEAPPGGTWLQLTGPEGAKEIIASVGSIL